MQQGQPFSLPNSHEGDLCWSVDGHDYFNSQNLIRSMEELLSSESSISSLPASSHGQVFRAPLPQQQPQQLPTLQPQHAAVPQAQLSQPVGHTGDGSTIYVNAENAAQLGLTGWAGHRVIALPGEMINPITLFVDLDSGQASAVPNNNGGNAMYHIPQQTAGEGMVNINSAATWAQLHGAAQPPQHLFDRSLGPGLAMDAPYGMVHGRGAYGHKGRHGRPHPQARNNLPSSSTVRTAAPMWAGADWNPLRNVQSWDGPRAGSLLDALRRSTPSGTGVFLPGIGMTSDAVGGSTSEQPGKPGPGGQV